MPYSDFHLHSTFSDGKNSPEEMVLAAIEKGMDALGFSDHSYTFFDQSYCIPKEKLPLYKEEILSLKAKYNDKIKVLCGIEQDYYSTEPTNDYDYVIGSVHYIKIGDEYIPVDESAETLKAAADKYFGGDILSLAEKYYKTVALLIEKTDADIIGHIDLITKFNESNALFDESSPRYQKAATEALDKLIKYGRPFEINTGAISRGYKTVPYPSNALTDYILSKGGKFILSSDSHSKDNLCYYFDNIKVPCENFLNIKK